MTKEELENRIQASLLFTSDQKNNILNTRWDDNIIQQLNDFFDKYGDYEKKAADLINKKSTNIAVKSLKSIENQQFEKEKEEIQKIEEKINEIAY